MNIFTRIILYSGNVCTCSMYISCILFLKCCQIQPLRKDFYNLIDEELVCRKNLYYNSLYME